MTEEEFIDGRKVLLRFTPLPPDPADKFHDCPQEVMILELPKECPAGLMICTKYHGAWDANGASGMRYMAKWMLAKIREFDVYGSVP